MRYLYYCNSAYQILNALNLNWHRKYASFENIENYSADVVILNAFPEAEKFAEELKKEDYFENAYLINRVKNSGRLHILKTVYGIVNPIAFLIRAGIENPKELKDRYDYIVVPKFSKGSAAIWQINKKAKLQLYEDGLALYIGITEKHGLIPSNKTYRVLYKIFNHGKGFDSFEKMYLNEKSMYYNENSKKAIQIPKFDSNFLYVLKSKFSNNTEILDNKNIVWFGQPVNHDNIENTRKSLLKHKELVAYKPHPRYGGDIEDFEIVRNSNAWELDLLNIKDLNNKCLITYSSTSVFTPKILYDFEPYVVFTFALSNKIENNDFAKLVEKFESTYKNKNRIIVSDSVEELNNYIELFINKD